VVVTDREFFGQHSLPPQLYPQGRRAASKQVDPNKLAAGDYVVHRNHGVGKFQAGKANDNENREYLVQCSADGLLRVAGTGLCPGFAVALKPQNLQYVW